MTDRDYSLADILIDKAIPDQLTCGICMDVFRDPIYCRGGHTWCQSCILLSNYESCPVCDYTVLPHTFNATVRDLIGTFLCKCPYNDSSLSSNNDNPAANMSADPSDSADSITSIPTSPETTSGGHSVDSGKECNWTGPYGRLQHHLESECPAEPRTLCLYAQDLNCSGCTLKGTKAQLAKHYLAVRVPYQFQIGPVPINLPMATAVARSPPCLLVLSTGRKCYIHFVIMFGVHKQNDCHLILDFSETLSTDDACMPCDITGSTIKIKHTHDPKKDLTFRFLRNRLVLFNEDTPRRVLRVFNGKSASLGMILARDVTTEHFGCYFQNDTLYMNVEMKADELTD